MAWEQSQLIWHWSGNFTGTKTPYLSVLISAGSYWNEVTLTLCILIVFKAKQNIFAFSYHFSRWHRWLKIFLVEGKQGPVCLKLRSHMRGAVAERRRADFEIPAPLPRVCSHIRGADAGGSTISWGQWWFKACGFEADAANWVLDPFLAERFLLPLRHRSATAHVWTHVMICVEANLPPASARACVNVALCCQYLVTASDSKSQDNSRQGIDQVLGNISASYIKPDGLISE